ncbi:MAG: CDP-alcohol phosphatidyltransferase family protein [Gammaproteobacteria bacterium]
MSLRFIPNLITGLRFLLVPPLVALLLDGRFGASLILFAFMGLSDAVDGFLAKRYGWHSRLGAFLDPLADKTMLVSAYLSLAWMGLLPVWFVAVIVVRDVVILGGAIAYQLVVHGLEMQPSFLSKLNTVAQIILVLAVILQQLAVAPGWLVTVLIWLTFLSTVSSGLAYVLEWSRRTLRSLGKDAA